ncbi:hypothetical protein D3C72_2214420 [compost metagenome]
MGACQVRLAKVLTKGVPGQERQIDLQRQIEGVIGRHVLGRLGRTDHVVGIVEIRIEVAVAETESNFRVVDVVVG